MRRLLLRLAFNSERRDRAESDEELDAYIAARVEQLTARGIGIEEARIQVIESLGAPIDEVRARLQASTIQRETRMRHRNRFDRAKSDLFFALRTLRKSPTFALTAILTIALGIGATTAIFSIVNSVLLRPLPYANADRLAFIWMDIRARNVVDAALPPGDLPDLIEQAPAFDAIAGFTVFPRATYIREDGKPELVAFGLVTPNFFSVLGEHIALGRDFVAADGVPPAGAPGADSTQPARLPTMTILTNAFWRSHLGADSSIVGKTIRVNGEDALVVGVTAPSFRLVYNAPVGVAGQPMMYQVLRMDYSTASRLNAMFIPIGRLRAGATWGSAQRQLDGFTNDLMNRFPIYRGGNIQMRAAPLTIDIAKSARPKILAFMGAVCFVLLIACANVANLLLVRASLRERELAVRAAIGGSRSQLIQQMLIESATLGALGAAVGLGLARLGIHLLLAIAPHNIPRLETVGIDLRVLAFTILAALVSSLLFGIVPALRASNPDLATMLRSGGRGASSGGTRLRQSVVVLEVALSFVLLVGSGLMVRTFIALGQVNPGFDAENVLAFSVANVGPHSADEVHAFVDQLAARLAAIPGVIGVTASNPPPLSGVDGGARWGPMAAADNPSLYRTATFLIVRPNFFEVMKAKVIAGHTFDISENFVGSEAIVIDNLAAARAFPGMAPNEALGKSVLVRFGGTEATPHRVVGVVAHLDQRSLDDPREGIYRPDRAYGAYATPNWAVRTSGDPRRVAHEVERAVAEVNASAIVADVAPLTDNVAQALAPTRFALILIVAFGAIAALLAAIGLYGVIATTVRERMREIGIRLALGASAESIMRSILNRGLKLSAIGMVIGLVGALGLTRVLSTSQLLFGVQPTDPLTYAIMIALFTIVAVAACWLPARSGMKLSPSITLRGD
ncbi:MAG TPA: ABC transporter permease [Gemmatimonadaceae bacterium]